MAKLTINGRDYTIAKHRKYGRYIMVQIEHVTPGMALDQGRFVARVPGTVNGQENPRTWEIRLDSGMSYIESRSTDERLTRVRVWIDE